MKNRRGGFTVMELVIALLIGSILTSIALTSFRSVRAEYAVRGSVTAFATLHAQARSGAIERGANTTLFIDAGGDSVAVVRNDTVMASVHFEAVYGVDLTSSMSSSPLRLCMSPRGHADEDCTSFSQVQKLGFVSNAESASVELLPLGQLLY